MEKKLLIKLRRKFVLTNMVLVFLVLATVFALVCVTNYNQSESQIYSALERSTTQVAKPLDVATQNSPIVNKPDAPEQQNEGTPAEQNPRGLPSDGPVNEQREMKDDQIVAVSTYEVNENGDVTSIIGDSLGLDESVRNSAIKEALDQVSAQPKTKGFLNESKLYFHLEKNEGRTVVSFASQNYVYTLMTSLFVNLGVACLCALLAFFIISYFLAKWALRPVETAWAQQSQFVADASHELKTPLSVILANMSILKKAVGKDNKCYKWICNTESEAQDMQVLVEDMLELTKAESQQTKKTFGKVNFSKIVESSALHFESVAFENGDDILEKIEPDLIVLGDETQLKRLASTLIENACKYSNNKAPINVSLKRLKDSCELVVSNSSENITKEELSHIFDRFYKTDKARTKQTHSFGLGLSIAKEIVTSHNGKIKAKNNLGITSFFVTLPINENS